MEQSRFVARMFPTKLMKGGHLKMFNIYKKKVKKERYNHQSNNSNSYRDQVIDDLLKNNGFYFF